MALNRDMGGVHSSAVFPFVCISLSFKFVRPFPLFTIHYSLPKSPPAPSTRIYIVRTAALNKRPER